MELDTAALRRHVRTWRERCRKDLLFLAGEVLGYDTEDLKMSDRHPVQVAMAKQATYLGDTMTLVPRSWTKSTTITVCGSVWWNINFPQDCSLLVSNTETNAQKFLTEIKGHYLGNDRFRLLFPEFCPTEAESGTLDSFRCANHSRRRKEATFEVTGMNASVTSRHYERIVMDDLVYKENVPPKVTPETMAKTFEYIRSMRALQNLVGKRNVRTIVGTRWHDGDAYGKVERDPGYRHFRKLKITPFDKDGESNWPEVFPVEKLNEMRADMGAYLWACLMEQDPLPPETAVSFREEWLKWYDPEDLVATEEEHPEFGGAILIDPAFSKNWLADRTAIGHTWVAESSPALVFLAERAGRWTPNQVGLEAFALWKEWRKTEFPAKWIGVEVDAGGRAVYNVLRDLAAEKGYNVRIRPLKTEHASKEARIAELSAYVERHGAYFTEAMGGMRQEFLRYPVGEHDDRLDMAAHRVLKLPRQGFEDAPVVVQDVTKVVVRPRTGADLLKLLHRHRSASLLRIK
jgi:hypothetical protein